MKGGVGVSEAWHAYGRDACMFMQQGTCWFPVKRKRMMQIDMAITV